MKQFCFLIIVTFFVIAHARKNNAPNFAQKRHDVSRPNSINSAEQKVQILKNEQIMQDDGSYRYQYETGNGISGMEHGTGGVGVQGASSYVSPEGVPIQLSYTADETGYHPQGDHIPKTPDYILRALEYIRTHPFKVIKLGNVRPNLSTEIAPPISTPLGNSRNLNYKPSSSFGNKNSLRSSQTLRNSRGNNLRRRF